VSRKREPWYQKTESMLYNYPSFEIRIKSHRAFIERVKSYSIAVFENTPSGFIASYELSEGANYNVSSPVEKDVNYWVDKQFELEAKYNQKIENLIRWMEIVENSIEKMLDPDQRELVSMTYWQRLPWQQICQEKLIDKNTFYAQRKDIVKVLAWCFGYLNDDDAQEILGLFAEEELWLRKAANN